MNRRPLVLLVLLAVGLGVWGEARASDAIEARYWDEAARESFRRRRYTEAMERFLLVQEIAPSPATLYNIALSAAQARRGAEAYGYFTDYLRAGDDDQARRADAQRRQARLARRLALVDVVSDPPGARIYIDRRELGAHGVTPRTVVVTPGAHRIELDRDGFVTAATEVVSRRGARGRVSVALTPRLGRLRVMVAPEGARWTLRTGDGVTVAEGAGASTHEVPAGRYTLRVAHPGHLDDERVMNIAPDALALADVTLTARASTAARLLVSAPPATGLARGTVYIDGVERGVLPIVVALPPGTHRLEVRPPPARRALLRRRPEPVAPFVIEVTLEAGETRHLRAGGRR